MKELLNNTLFQNTINHSVHQLQWIADTKTLFQWWNSFFSEVEGVLHCDITFLSFFWFCVACKAYKEWWKGNWICYVVDDLSLPLDTRALLKQQFTFPELFQATLAYYEIPENDVILCFESVFRNRWNNDIKKYKKRWDIVKKEWWYVTAEWADVISNPIWAPLCRLIVAEFLKDIEKRWFDQCVNIHDETTIKCMGRFAVVYQKLLWWTMKVINMFTSWDNPYRADIEMYENGLVSDAYWFTFKWIWPL